MKNYMRKEQGFTLLEVMIAMTILAIGLLGLAGLQITSVRSNSSASQVSEATVLAQDQLEQLRGTPFANLVSGSSNVTGRSGIAYRIQWTVTKPVGENHANIDMQVSWARDSAYQRPFRISSVIGEF
jgi:type IV pilus modification protein PilV